MGLAQICDEYILFSDNSVIWEHQDGADGECEFASQDFIKYLSARNIYGEMVVFSARKKAHLFGKRRADYFYDEAPHKWYRAHKWSEHVAVRVGNEIVDWTARQFHPNAPFPLIFILKKE